MVAQAAALASEVTGERKAAAGTLQGLLDTPAATLDLPMLYRAVEVARSVGVDMAIVEKADLKHETVRAERSAALASLDALMEVGEGESTRCPAPSVH